MKLEEWQFIVVIIGTIITTILSVLGACIGFFKVFGESFIRPWVLTIFNTEFEKRREELLQDNDELENNVQRYKREFRGYYNINAIDIANLKVKIEHIENEFTKVRLIFDRILDETFYYKEKLNDFINYLKTPKEIRDKRDSSFQDRDNSEKKRFYKQEIMNTSILDSASCPIDFSGYSGDLSQSRSPKRNPKDFDSTPPRE